MSENMMILEMLKRVDESLAKLTDDFHNHAVHEEGRLLELELDLKRRQRVRNIRNGFIGSAILAVGSYVLPFTKNVSVDFIKEPKAVVNKAAVDENGAI